MLIYFINKIGQTLGTLTRSASRIRFFCGPDSTYPIIKYYFSRHNRSKHYSWTELLYVDCSLLISNICSIYIELVMLF